MFDKHKAAKEQARAAAEQAEAAAAEQAARTLAVREFIDTLVAPDGGISPEAARRFDVYCRDHGYIDEHGASTGELPRDVLLTLLLGKANAGDFVQVATTLLLKRGEVCYLERDVSLLKEVAQREYQAGSHGVSVPLGHGVRYRTGAVRGHMVTIGTHWQAVDTGRLTITNTRVVYHGGRKTLEFPFAKLATLKTYSDAIDLGVTTRQTTSSFRLAEPHVAAGMIRAAFNARTP